MNDRSVYVLEPNTGDEVRVDIFEHHVALSVRGETDAWITVRIGQEAVRELAAMLNFASGRGGLSGSHSDEVH